MVAIAMAMTFATASCWPTSSVEEEVSTGEAERLLEVADRLAWDAFYERAREAYRESRSAFDSQGNTEGVIRAMIGEAVQHREIGSYDSSLAVLMRASRLLPELEDGTPVLRTDIDQERGSTMIRLSQYEDAAALFRDVIRRRLSERTVDSTRVGKAYHGLGWAYHEMHVFGDAKTYNRLALEWYASSKEGLLERSRSLNTLGNLEYRQQHYSEAGNLLAESVHLKAELLRPNHPLTAFGKANLANYLHQDGKLFAALNVYEDALRNLEASFGELHPEIAIGRSNIANIYQDAGLFESSRRNYLQALRTKRAILPRKHPSLSYTLDGLGRLFLKLGDPEDAKPVLLEAYRIREESFSAESAERFDSLLRLAQVYSDLNDRDSSEFFFELATQRLSELENGNIYYEQMGRARLILSDILADTDNHESRIQALQASKILRSVHGTQHPSVYLARLKLADADRRLGRNSYAHESYSRLVADILVSKTHSSWFDVNYALIAALIGQALTRADLVDQAELELARDLDRIKNTYAGVRVRMNENPARFALSRKLWEERWLPALTTLRQKYRTSSDASSRILLQQALHIAETGKAQSLVDELARTASDETIRHSPKLSSIESNLETMIASYQEALQSAISDQIDVLEIAVSATSRYDSLIANLEAQFPDYYNLKYNTTVATIAEIQNVLRPNEALLEYSIADSIYIFGITTDSTMFIASAASDSLENTVEALVDGISKQRFDRFARASTQLYDELIRPTESFIRNKELIIIPDGVLNYVPFEALIPSQLDTLKNYQTLPYLLRNHPISYSYSATLLAQLRSSPDNSATKDFLGIAPVFKNGKGINGRSLEFISENGNARSDDPIRRTHLPGSLAEVLEIRRAFNQSYSLSDRFFGGRTKLLLNADASETNVKKAEISDYRYVHFATHAFANDNDGEQSGMVLTADDSNGDDGILRLAEVYNLKLNSDVVVLSACETGLGELESGEGMIGLTRGFLYAGTKNVVVSIWKADDTATKNLMIPFYSSLLDGSSPAVALQKAKLSTINSDRFYARPYYWAQFIVHGR